MSVLCFDSRGGHRRPSGEGGRATGVHHRSSAEQEQRTVPAPDGPNASEVASAVKDQNPEDRNSAGLRRTKIVCTLGPQTDSAPVLRGLIAAGMDVARFNLSHGTHAEHRARLAALRSAEQAVGRRVAVIFDLRGPEVRLLFAEEGPISVNAGDVMPLPRCTWPGLAAALRPGQTVLLADGAICAGVIPASGAGDGAPILRFTSGGVLRDCSKIVVPGLRPELPPISEQDADDVRLGIEEGADLFAMSFVHQARDILELKDLIRSSGGDQGVVAKIETRAGYENLQSILAVADGVMVARGDLGVQCPFDEVPRMQKEILSLCVRFGKPGITATEMLESMTRQSRPTRAEASDVFNAVLDGADALMLSGETAVGSHPVESCAAMAQIALQAERTVTELELRGRSGGRPVGRSGLQEDAGASPTPAVAIAEAAVGAARAVGADALITPTRSGFTARMVARLRPDCPIIAVSPDPRTVRVLNLTWGVTSLLGEDVPAEGDHVGSALKAAVAAGLVGPGDLVAVTSGVPAGLPGTTNMVQLRTIGEIIARGTGIVGAAAMEEGRAVVTGPLCVVSEPEEVADAFRPGCILALPETCAATVPYIRRAGAVLTREGGLSSHAAVVCLSLGVPVVVGVRDATDLPHGEVVTVDGPRGLVYRGRVRPA